MTPVASAPKLLHWGVLLAAVVVVELIVLLVVLDLGGAPIAPGDAPYYAALGHNIAANGGHAAGPDAGADVSRTPGYPAFLGALYTFGGGSETVVRAAQVVLVGLTAAVVAVVAARCFGGRTALLAALGCVTYVPLVLFSMFHLTEVLATFLLTVAVLAVLRAQASAAVAEHRLWCGAATVVLFALAMVRPSGLVCFAMVPLVALLWREVPIAGRLLTAAGTVSLMLILMVPWAARNHAVSGAWIPLGAGSGVSLYASSLQYRGLVSSQPTLDDFDRIYDHVLPRQEAIEDRQRGGGAPSLARVQYELDRGLVQDAADEFDEAGAARVARMVPTRVAGLWSPGALPGMMPARAQGPVARVAQVQHVALLVLTAAGAFMQRRRLWELWPVWISAVLLTALHLVFHVEARYSMPARPLLFTFAAVAVASVVQDALGSHRAPPT